MLMVTGGFLLSAVRSRSSQLAFQRCAEDLSLETRDRRGRLKMFRTPLGAAHVRVTGVTTGIPGDSGKPFPICDVAHIVHERPRASQSCRTQIVRPPFDDIA